MDWSIDFPIIDFHRLFRSWLKNRWYPFQKFSIGQVTLLPMAIVHKSTKSVLLKYMALYQVEPIGLRLSAPFFKRCKPLARARGQTYTSWRLLLAAAVFAIFPSFIDFLTIRVVGIIQRILIVIREYFLRFGRYRDKQKMSLNIKTFLTLLLLRWGLFCTSRIEKYRQKAEIVARAFGAYEVKVTKKFSQKEIDRKFREEYQQTQRKNIE